MNRLPITRPYTARVMSLVLLAIGSGCSGGGGSATPAVLPAAVAAPPGAPAPAAAASAGADDWTTFAHDAMRTGYESQATGISTSSVATLATHWTVLLGETIKASPLVAGGFVYVAGQNGTVRALAAATGSTVWQQTVTGSVDMTPTLDAGTLYVGTHTEPSTFVALDAATGAKKWSASFAGSIRSEPVVFGDVVYIGDASGDPPTCNRGAVHGLDVTTGAEIVTWYDTPAPRDGGGIWAPLSTDGRSLFFGTGNACVTPAPMANSIVRLSATGSPQWSYNAANVESDDDFGTNVLLSGSDAIATNKNGTMFDFDAATGTVRWSLPIGTLDGYGPVGSASTDGHTIVTDAGYLTDPTVNVSSPGARIVGLDRGGTRLWSLTTTTEDRGNTPIAGGVAFAAVDGTLMALDARSGTHLWSAPLGGPVYASPAVIPSGVYIASSAGVVTAFALPAR